MFSSFTTPTNVQRHNGRVITICSFPFFANEGRNFMNHHRSYIVFVGISPEIFSSGNPVTAHVSIILIFGTCWQFKSVSCLQTQLVSSSSDAPIRRIFSGQLASTSKLKSQLEVRLTRKSIPTSASAFRR